MTTRTGMARARAGCCRGQAMATMSPPASSAPLRAHQRGALKSSETTTRSQTPPGQAPRDAEEQYHEHWNP
eukprot:3588141-Pyramimonas_sp.AAC.1